MQKKLVYLLLIFIGISFLSLNMVSSEDQIKWINDKEDAFEKAKEEDKDVFVFVTAPDWCENCLWVEENILPDKKLQKILNKDFVSLKVLDKIEKDGKLVTNPDLDYFNIIGFPMMMVYDKNGKLIKQIKASFVEGKFDANRLISELIKISMGVIDTDDISGESGGGSGCEGGVCPPPSKPLG